MARIDDKLPFLPVNIAVLTISDTRTPADDKSGDRLVAMITSDAHTVAARAIVSDDRAPLTTAPEAPIDDTALDSVTPTPATAAPAPAATPQPQPAALDQELQAT